jgi:C-terminal processing protease CtpA/Prc
LNPAEPGEPYPSWRTFTQTIPWSDDWKYAGKTVMLMDERTVSQAEHTGLFLKAANGTTLIGSPTTGANGDVTNFSLPGGIKVGLTGQSVAHPDGTQLQRVGLTPDIHVTPTIKAVRDGVDEVLERALGFMTLFQVEKATAYTP